MNYKKKLIFLSVLVPLLMPHCGYANEGMMEDMLLMKDMQGIATPVAIQNGIKTVVVIGAVGYAGVVAWRYRRNILKDLTVLKKDTATIKDGVERIERTQAEHTNMLNTHHGQLKDILSNQDKHTESLLNIEKKLVIIESTLTEHATVTKENFGTIALQQKNTQLMCEGMQKEIAAMRESQKTDSKVMHTILGQVVSHRAESGKGLLELLKDKVSNRA